MALSFGVTSTGYPGVVQSAEMTGTAEFAEAKDGLGKTTDIIAYTKKTEVKADFLIDGAEVANAGALITMHDVPLIVSSVSFSEKNTEYESGSITGYTKDDATLVALT